MARTKNKTLPILIPTKNSIIPYKILIIEDKTYFALLFLTIFNTTYATKIMLIRIINPITTSLPYNRLLHMM
ncbi:MAG: hypothetical protein N2B06_13505 [Clostridium sp.]